MAGTRPEFALCAAVGICLLCAGCIPTQEDIQTTRREMTLTTTALQEQLAAFKTATESRQETAESRLDSIENRVAAIEQAVAAQRAGTTEALEAVRQEIRLLTGKVNESEFALREALQKANEEQERKNTDFRRDIEALRKSQNELLPILTEVSKGLTEMSRNQTEALSRVQNDLLALKDAQVKLKDAFQQHLAEPVRVETAVIVEAVKEDLRRQIDDEWARKVQVLLSEVVRQESELARIRAQVAALSGTPKTPASVSSPRPATPAASAARPTTYTVKAGDTLTAVARQYGTTVQKLREANPRLGSRSYLITGEKLTIPKP